MKKTWIVRLTAGIAGLAMLAACGNSPSAETTGRIIKQVPQILAARRAEPRPLTAEQVGRALAATDAPIIMLQIESRKSQTLLIEIERNGPYRTFATSARQSVVIRNGLVTATRGLGGDLMSSEEDALLEMVRGRKHGVVRYTQRYLTPEDVTEAIDYDCLVKSEGTTSVPTTAGPRTATEMQAICESDGRVRTMTFLVDGNGNILSARQWLGETTGFVGVQVVRG
ncbi:YjbF family lipoprotein [Thalassococcus sp. CAU 1522]|uniref:YjbF family lipoprotein n=1 Tax=Thalassococcus arenae TaxID=2851652 RepID=A0ABS6N6D8_9RHOB|nr:YjbF family lipoprotein [Thalassococcus arenae]MBV2359353.1 YjbF family lipoprotein [Thalassococcus arenae]